MLTPKWLLNYIGDIRSVKRILLETGSPE